MPPQCPSRVHRSRVVRVKRNHDTTGAMGHWSNAAWMERPSTCNSGAMSTTVEAQTVVTSSGDGHPSPNRPWRTTFRRPRCKGRRHPTYGSCNLGHPGCGCARKPARCPGRGATNREWQRGVNCDHHVQKGRGVFRHSPGLCFIAGRQGHGSMALRSTKASSSSRNPQSNHSSRLSKLVPKPDTRFSSSLQSLASK